MKSGTAYAARLKKVYAKFCQSAETPRIPGPDDALHRLAVAVLGVGCSDQEAQEALERVFTVMADWNEIRVSRPFEVHKAMGGKLPDEPKRIQPLINALQAVFDRENQLSLERLKSLGRREARQYLEQLDGVDEHAVASVFLWSLGGHAIPVNDRLYRVLREKDLVHPLATRAEVQAFLERHISAAAAKEFCIIMQSFPGPRRAAGSRRPRATARESSAHKSVASTGKNKKPTP